MGAARKGLRRALVSGAVLGLAGCGLFFAPLSGRWNPTDPDVELVSVVRPLEPVQDGYVDSDNYRDFGGTQLPARDTKAPNCRSLLRFDWSRAPLSVVSATLKIRCSTATQPLGVVWVYRITEPWEPSSLSWTQVTSTYFSYSSGTSSDGIVAGEQYALDLTLLVQALIDEPQWFDLLLVPENCDVAFESSRGADPPVLELAGQDIPD